MYGIGNISNHLSDTLSPTNGLGLVPPMRSRAGNAFEIDYVPIDRIYTDEKNFQNRGDKFSQRSVDSIVNAAKNGTFNWFAFDPITIWENPKDGKKYVLSGHSRTQAFRELSKLRPYIEIDGLTFDRIPAKIYRGSFDDARRLALNSNTLATPETLTERAAYYRNIRNTQNITTPKELKALKEKALRENNGQMIWDLSFLPEGGISFDSLKAFRLGEQSGSTENFLRLATICQWIGKAFQIYSGLSRAHDRELFNFLMSGGYGSKHGQFFSFSALNERLQKLYEKNVKKLDKMNADGEYTEPFQIAAFKHSSSELDKIAELKKIVDKAYKELQQGIKYVRDAKIPAYINGKENPQFWDYLRGLYYQWINALLEMWKVSEPKEAKQVPSLFGILGIDYGLGRISTPYRKKNDVDYAQFISIATPYILPLDPKTPLKVDIELQSGHLYSDKANSFDDALQLVYKHYRQGNPFYIIDKWGALMLMFDYDFNGNQYFANEDTYSQHFPKNVDYQTQEKFVIKQRRIPEGEPFLTTKQANAKKEYDNAHNTPKLKASDVFVLYDNDSPRMRFAAEKVAESLSANELSESSVKNKLYDFIFTRKLPNYNEDIDDTILESLFDRIVDGLGRLVYHNSPYSFGRFDSSHMSEGEGTQVHGWGHYVSVNNLTKYGHRRYWNVEDVFDVDFSNQKQLKDLAQRIFGEFLHYVKYANTFTPEQLKDYVYHWALETKEYGGVNDYVAALELMYHIPPHFNRNNYIVEIPDDDGFNYIQEDKPLTEKQWRKIVKALAKQGITSVSEYEIPIGRNAYDFIADLLTDDYNPEAASKFLKKLGFVGIHYFGNVDGEGYVIFDDNDLKIKEHTLYGTSHTVNDKPAAVFNCHESELDCRGYKPTYKRLADYSHLIDAADGAKTLKGYGFEKSTLDELVNACKQYKQVERLAAHLKDDDKMQSAFNIWHWLHTNINYNYDTPGEEEIRTPARTWADRKSGVDCDCLAVFTACLLLNMGYNPCFEIVAFNNSPKFSHIYVNLDGAAIDRVLPVFLQRPANITKTKIMEIPVYELSGVGVGRCDNSLSGVYNSTLAKIQSGTASGNDLNNYRKTQVLVTLKGIDEDAYKLAALLMPHIATIGDDGKYYFDSAKFAEIATKADAGLSLLKQQGASKEVLQNWLAEVVRDVDIAEDTVTASKEDDTIVIVINPKGYPTNVTGQYTAAELPTLTPMSQTATEQDQSASASQSPIFATSATPPKTDTEKDSPNWWLIAGIAAVLGIAVISKRGGSR